MRLHLIKLNELTVQVFEHGHRLEFREIREVEAVIGQGDFEKAVALLVGHTEKVHRGVVHAHHQLYLLRIFRLQEITMEGRNCTEDTLTEIEKVAKGKVL
jgi:hypothetical protein